MVQTNIIQDRLQELFPVHYRNGNILLINADCMDVMKHIKDKEVELSCVDPPYGIDVGNMAPTNSDRKAGRTRFNKSEGEPKTWDMKVPQDTYFKELMRVSKNQIIWGGNYFNLRPSRGIICWDKQQYMPSFSQWEMAWTSFDYPASLFKYNNGTGDKIHPTQKPVALYKWLLSRYAKPGDRILDTHGGSGSICIACHDLGYDLTWMELDKDYYDAACERYRIHASQTQLFQPEPAPKPKESSLF